MYTQTLTRRLYCWSVNVRLAALLVLLTVSQVVKAQNGAARPDRGVTPGHSYTISDIEKISLTNGNVNLAIPLASLPPMSGSNLSWTIQAVYNSKGWDVKRKDKIQGSAGAQARFMEELPQQAESGVQSGWIVGGIYTLEYRESRDDVDWINDPQEGSLNWWKVIFTAPDGATHELKPVDFQPNFGDRTFLFGLYNVNPVSVGSPMKYYSSDGSFLWAYIYNTGPISWRVYMKDGMQVIQYANGTQRIVDTNLGNSSLSTPNQNSILIFTDSNGTTTTTHYQDERTGREIRKVIGLNDQITVQYQAVGGNWVSIQLTFGTTTVFGKIFEKTTYSGPDQTCQRKELLESSDIQVLREILLPQTQPGEPQRKFTFSYNSDETISLPSPENWYLDCTSNFPQPVNQTSKGWGSLSQMIMPSGAKVNYSYTNDVGAYIGTAEDIPRDSIYTKSLEHDGLPVETWNYAIGYTGSSVTAPDGAVTTEASYVHDYGYGGSGVANTVGLAGLSYRTNQSDKIITERRWVGMKFTGGQSLGPNGHTTFNPVVDTEYVTLKEGGQAVKMSAKKYQYDYNGNVKQVIEYDWFDPSPVNRDSYGIPLSVPPGATVLRTTTTEYHTPADDAGSANVYAKRVMGTSAPPFNEPQAVPLILSAPKQVTNGPSQTQFRYDNLAYGTAPTIGHLTHK
ncbi:MAG: hypothetical protein HOP19_11250 [Acidobacteria bacterium]|nr:hypothetical protein [Acidobacteriota bacterium]